MIKNEHKINDSLSTEIRKANETRGLWYYELVKSAGKYGLDEEVYARSAIRKLGNLYRGLYPDTDSVPEFMGAFLNDHNIKQFHMELKSLTDEEAVVHFHYCPMWTEESSTCMITSDLSWKKLLVAATTFVSCISIKNNRGDWDHGCK